MKRIITLCFILASLISVKAQDLNSEEFNQDSQSQTLDNKKQKKQKKQNSKSDNKDETTLQYQTIQKILDNKSNLKLSSYQASALQIKNEYIKRDMRKLNADRLITLSEKKLELEKLSASYNLFIQRVLNPEQIKDFALIQTNAAPTPEYNKATLRLALRELDAKHKENVKEIKKKYKGNKQVYYAQRNQANKRYEYDRVTTIELYKNKQNGIDTDQDNYVMTLEEISNIAKAYDDYYSKEQESNPLDYLEIREEYQQDDGYLDVYPDELPGSQQYNEEGDY